MSTPGPDIGSVDPAHAAGDRLELAKAIDEISLEQALIDVELANSRVIDLTSRLLSARRELVSAQDQAKFYKDVAASLEAELDAIHRSRTYAVARRLLGIKKLIR